MALQALALRGGPPIESQPEQPFPELPRPREVIGRKLDQLDRHHPFSLCRPGPVRRYRRTVTTAAEILNSRVGYTEFRPGQQHVVDSLLAGRSALAVFPTRAGKSLCYQLPALMLDGVTVVVSPLIALMKDQIDLLARVGVDAARLKREAI
jgi:superfamily II DNA helicase RecQ